MESDSWSTRSRTDTFPAGLRVLVVDDDHIRLNILERMLNKCSYQGTTCYSAKDALELLREMKDCYDIVISDVNMPEMDGFKLLEHIRRETDLPVILMSVDGETSRVMKGIQLGACDYLVKPLRMKELRNIWQHAFRRKIQEEVRDLEGMHKVQMAGNGLGKYNGGHLLTSEKKGKDVQNEQVDKAPGSDSSTNKFGVNWAVDLHKNFDKAVTQTGHSKENYLKISPDGINYSGSASRDSTASVGTQYSCNGEYKAVTSSSCGFSGSSLLLGNVESRSYESEEEGIVSVPAVDSKMSLSTDDSDTSKSISSQAQFSHSSISSGSGANSTGFDSTFLFRPTTDICDNEVNTNNTENINA